MQDQLRYLYEKYGLQNVTEVENKFLELSTIYNMSDRLRSAESKREIANLLLLVPMGRLLISKSALILFEGNKNLIIGLKGSWKNINRLEQINLKPDNIVENIDTLKKKLTKTDFTVLEENEVRLIIPLTHGHNVIGMALLGKKFNGTPLQNREISFLRTIFDLGTQAIYNVIMIEKLKDKNQQLDSHIQLLATIFETVKGFNFDLDEEKITKIFYFTLMGQLMVNKFAIIYRKDNEFNITASKGFASIPETDILELQKIIKDNQIIYLNEDLSEKPDSPFLICIPNFTQNHLTAYLLIGQKADGSVLKTHEIEFAQILLSQTITALQNMTLLKEKIAKEKMEQELQLARKIQDNLLPDKLPVPESFDIYAYNEPSKEVGGDYYDIIKKDNHIYLVIADVSGKSVSAALLMSNLQSALHLLLDLELPVTEITEKLNGIIYKNTTADKFITFFLGKLDIESGNMEYVNAGHNPPIIYNHRTGKKELLEKGGIILGMFPQFEFEHGFYRMEKDDLLFLFTDGVNETVNENEEEWGDENLLNFIIKESETSASDFGSKLLDTLNKFKGEFRENYDDITYVIIKKSD